MYSFRGSVSFLCLWLSGFPSTVYKRECSFPIVYSWLFCPKLINHIHLSIVLGYLCQLVCLCLCLYHTILITKALVTFFEIREDVASSFGPISRLLSLFEVLCGSIQILGLTILDVPSQFGMHLWRRLYALYLFLF